MSLPGQIEAATASVPGFDSDTRISSSLAQEFYAQGYKFCIRYLSLGPQASTDLGDQEAIDILNSGLALMPVQHVRKPGWAPTLAAGDEDAEHAVTNAEGIGFPSGVNIWCDLEGVSAASQAEDIIEYCEAWSERVKAAGYVPGLYVGARALLTGEQLGALSFEHYWKSQSNVPEISGRGYQLIQMLPSISLNGISVDVDIAKTDKAGGRALWLRSPS